MRNRMGAMALVAAISLNTLAGVPIAWDIRLGMDSFGSAPTPYNVTAARGETLDFMPRFTDRGAPLSITTNSAIRVYLREYGTTNAFTASYLSGAVYTNTADLGRVLCSLLPSDVVAATNQFFVGCDVGGRIYRAYGKLTMLDSPGGEPGTNTTVRGIVDWATVDSVNLSYAPFLLSSYTYTPTSSNLAAIASMVAPETSNIVNAAISAIPSVTAASIGALTAAATNGFVVTRLTDSSAPATYFQTVEYGTGTVWQVTGPFTNYTVTLSSDFADTTEGAHPSWTNNTFPFVDGLWNGVYDEYIYKDMIYFSGSEAKWIAPNPKPYSYPVVLLPDTEAVGTATINAHPYMLTNAFSTSADAVTLNALRADFDAYAPPSTDIIAAVNPYALTVYGANSMTNDAGYGAVLATNNATAVGITAADPAAGQVIAAYQYSVPSDHIFGTASLSHYLTIQTGIGTSAVAIAVETFTDAGALVSSNDVATCVRVGGFNLTTNVVTSFALPSVAYGGVVRVTLRETIGGIKDVTAHAGGAYPFALTVPLVPTAYATQGQVVWTAGTLYGTNGTYRTVGTNTYWIMTP